MWETWIQSLGQEDPLEKGMGIPVFLPGEFNGQRILVGYSLWDHKKLNTDWQLVSYMILYIFQCPSPKSSHPLPLPQSPKEIKFKKTKQNKKKNKQKVEHN